MKTKNLFLISIAVIGAACAFSQAIVPPKVDLDTLPVQELREVNNQSFRSGEKLKYTVHYGWMDAGEAVLEVKESPYTFNGRRAFHVVGTGTSLGAFDWFFKVRDRYETYIDQEGLFPYRFIRNCDEGGYKIFQDYTFHPDRSAMITHEGDTLFTPQYIQDMISAYYFTRNLDCWNARKGDIFTVQTIVNGEIYPMKVKYVGKEVVSIRAGKFRCLKFVPVVQEGRIFKTEDDLHVWITDDKNKIPILAESTLLVGSIKMEMTEWQGLANPLSKVN